jgi:hypothetical protein
MERQFGFWTSYLMASGSLLIAVALLVVLGPRLGK